ncbi:MAG: hypothetical protein ACK2U3_14455 [Anaerolineales bacterium]
MKKPPVALLLLAKHPRGTGSGLLSCALRGGQPDTRLPAAFYCHCACPEGNEGTTVAIFFINLGVSHDILP